MRCHNFVTGVCNNFVTAGRRCHNFVTERQKACYNSVTAPGSVVELALMTGVDVDGYVVDFHVVCSWLVYLVVELDASMAADCTPRLRLGEVVVVVDLAERTCGTDDTCYARHVTGPDVVVVRHSIRT